MNDSLPAVPPFNLESEQAILGAILLEPTALSVALETVSTTDFYLASHQHIFAAMQRIIDRGETLDNLTLGAELKMCGNLDTVGGMSYIAELINSVASSANILSHAKITRDIKLLRELRALGMVLSRKATEGNEPVQDMLGWAEQALFQVAHGHNTGHFQSITGIVTDGIRLIDAVASNPRHIVGIPTGFDALDKLLSGWQRTDLIIVGGRPSMGKTSLAMNTAVAAAKSGFGVGVFSLEMSKRQLGVRLLSAESGIDSHALKTGNIAPAAFHALAHAAGVLEKLPMWVDDSGDITLTMLRAKARRLKAQHDISLIVVDYLQLMHGADGVESRQQEISSISRGLKLMAKELDIAVIALSQLNRSLENRIDKRPQLSDLRESGAIEQDADVVCFLYRDEVYDKETLDRGVAECLVKKQRNGPIGDVRLGWTDSTASFYNAD